MRRVTSIDIEQCMKNEPYSLQYVPTKYGGLRINVCNNNYEFHYNRNGIKYWRCLNHSTTKCKSVAISKDCSVFLIESRHNHTNNAQVIHEAEDNDDNDKDEDVANLEEHQHQEEGKKLILSIKEQMKLKLQKALNLNN